MPTRLMSVEQGYTRRLVHGVFSLSDYCHPRTDVHSNRGYISLTLRYIEAVLGELSSRSLQIRHHAKMASLNLCICSVLL